MYLLSLMLGYADIGPYFGDSMISTLIYVALSLFLLANTLGTLYPRLYPGELTTPMAFMSMMLMFWIPQWILIGILTTLLFTWLGALSNPIGQAALIIHVLCWAVLVGQLWRMHRSLPLLDGQPVGDDDMPFCVGLLDEEREQMARGSISWKPSLTFRIPEMLDVEVTRDVIFREIGRVRLRLDVYRGKGEGPRPAAVYIHGGAWVLGNRRQSQFMCYSLAASGWVVFSISYRFAPKFPLPAAIEDCKAAVAWVREHAAEYGILPDQIVVMGGSAGGHLAAMVALSANEPRLQPGFEQADTRVQGAVILYGVTDFVAAFDERRNPTMARFLEWVVFRQRFRDNPELFRLSQPASYLSADAPPILLVHGMNDYIVPIRESRFFAQKLRDAGAPEVHLLEMPGALHAYEVFPSPAHQRTVRVILRFMEQVRESCRGRKGQAVRQLEPVRTTPFIDASDERRDSVGTLVPERG